MKKITMKKGQIVNDIHYKFLRNHYAFFPIYQHIDFGGVCDEKDYEDGIMYNIVNAKQSDEEYLLIVPDHTNKEGNYEFILTARWDNYSDLFEVIEINPSENYNKIIQGMVDTIKDDVYEYPDEDEEYA